jgi:DnaJ-class molecular chaperone
MKSKLLTVAFIAILLCSALNVALTMAQCPTCHGTGKIECPYCDGTGEITIEEGEPCGHCSGSGTLTPTIILTSKSTHLSDGKIFVQVKYKNEEDVSSYGRVTAEVEVQTNTYTATSSDTTLPAHEETEINFAIEGIHLQTTTIYKSNKCSRHTSLLKLTTSFAHIAMELGWLPLQ